MSGASVRLTHERHSEGARARAQLKTVPLVAIQDEIEAKKWWLGVLLCIFLPVPVRPSRILNRWRWAGGGGTLKPVTSSSAFSGAAGSACFAALQQPGSAISDLGGLLDWRGNAVKIFDSGAMSFCCFRNRTCSIWPPPPNAFNPHATSCFPFHHRRRANH